MKSATRGFTLLEILIAIAVFAIMSVMAYAGLHAVLNAKVSTEQTSERLAQLQLSLFLLGEDFNYLLPRSIRDEYGAMETALHSGHDNEVVTLTRSVPAWTRFDADRRLQRISYRLEKGWLYRQTWTQLDRSQQTETKKRRLLEVQDIRLRFYDQEWYQDWNNTSLPQAIEVNIKIKNLGDVKRLYFLHE